MTDWQIQYNAGFTSAGMSADETRIVGERIMEGIERVIREEVARLDGYAFHAGHQRFGEQRHWNADAADEDKKAVTEVMSGFLRAGKEKYEREQGDGTK